MHWLVTGGAGFIGSCFVREAIGQGWTDHITVLDALTYAGNEQNLAAIAGRSNWRLHKGDIRRADDVRAAIGTGVDAIFHFAAESHVDRSIAGAAAFVDTNVLGTQVLIDVARSTGCGRFVHVSTDEVYGALELGSSQRFTEQTPLHPTSPYAASKAGSDHLVLAAAKTHQFDAVVTRCSNNYGPYQHPEKFIPLFITRALGHDDLPLYGDGKNVRDWIHVEDHVRGIYCAYRNGKSGHAYNLGGECERANHDIAHRIVALTGADPARIKPVTDRLAHDRRYAIDPTFAQATIGFVPGRSIDERLPEIVDWYRNNEAWWRQAKGECASMGPAGHVAHLSPRAAMRPGVGPTA